MKNDITYLERWCDDLIIEIGELKDKEEKHSTSWNYYNGYVSALKDIKQHFKLPKGD